MSMTLALAWALAIAGATYWLIVSVTGLRTVAALRRLVDEPDLGAAAGSVPRTSIVVAARDEAATLRHEVGMLEAIDHPDLELVLVDDRSTDATGRLMDDVARENARVQVVHINELPHGWLGKVHALEQGRRCATGEWLLFTDADVELDPTLPRRAVALAEQLELDALALLPSVHSRSVLVAGVVATFSRWLVVGAGLWRAADPDRPDAFGVGACNLVRRDALESAGGFYWLRMDVADDAALANLVASRGGRTMLASGMDLVHVEWQQSVGGMTQGFEKYGGTGGVGSVPGAIALASLALLGEVAPWFAAAVVLASGQALAPLLLALGTIVLANVVAVVTTRRSGAPLRGLLAGPMAPALVWWMQVRAALLEWRRGGVVWRGTFYASEQLRAGKRYRLRGLGRGR
ncbi:MAG: hypothetical protein JWM25_1756 [Thermoleophilia bacterium]|nr:hypothetical protein [Thermoleophilia bacterium]MCZ4497171.1 hypothetical protein [Thermoleophilia bacterium]